jgi:hypothetical protein
MIARPMVRLPLLLAPDFKDVAWEAGLRDVPADPRPRAAP